MHSRWSIYLGEFLFELTKIYGPENALDIWNDTYVTGINNTCNLRQYMKQIWQNKHNVCILWTFKSNSFSCLVILNEGKVQNSNNANLLIEDRKRANIFILNEQSRPWKALISISFWMIDRPRYKLYENHQVCYDSSDHLEKRSFLFSWSLRKFLN